VWEESDIFPQVIFEVWSPNNRYDEMQVKFAFYEKYGAEEYYILYPEFPMYAEAYRRDGAKFARVAEVNGYVSPRTGLRFVRETGQLTVFGRDGRPLRTAEELAAEAERAAKLAAKLRELGVDPDTI
jgi:Uma2 family endonuclease